MPLRWSVLAERSDEQEFLDGELDLDDLRANLREMAMLNRLPGGTDASMAGLHRLIGARRDASILDVGTGRADMPLAFARRRGWRVMAVDNRPEILALARRRVRHEPRVDLLEADARALPLGDGSVDVAHASLLHHHLAPSDALAVLREMRRVARLGVVINDLRRGPAAYLLTWATVMALTRNRYTRHDGVVAARRAYALQELDALLRAVGLRPTWRSPGWLPRVTTVAVAA